jgi:hypothetical protein
MTVSDLLHSAVVALASMRPGPGVGGRGAAALRSAGLRALLAGMLVRRHLGELLGSLERGGAPAPAMDGSARAVLAALRRRPTTCLYRSLAGYAVLRSEGQDVRFVIGVRPERGELLAHAWLEQGGIPVGEPGDPRAHWAVALVHPAAPATEGKETEIPMSQLRPNPDVLLTELKDGTGVLLHLRTKFYYALNQTGVAVWKLVAEGQAGSAEALAVQIAARFRDTPADAAQRDVSALLRELEGEGLLLKPGQGPPGGG